ncbi:hypothetical protein P9112_012900 [Eukaryota sp. TZLM1-RC]
MVGSRDRDNRRKDRPKRPTLDAADLRDVEKLLKFVNKFILWSRTGRIVDEARVEDPAPVALASEVARLREELELARSAELASEQRFNSEPVHEWDFFRSAMHIHPRALNALRYQGTGLSISSAMVPTSRDERNIWKQILRRTQFSRLDQALDALHAVNMDWTERDYGNRWIDFMINIGRILTRSTAIRDTHHFHGNPVDRLPEWEIASLVIEGIGITVIRDRLLRIWSNPSHYYSYGHTLGEFFSVLQIEYENFCNARFFQEQINYVDFLYQKRISFQTENHRRQTVPSPPAIPKPTSSGSSRRPKQQRREGGSTQPSSTQSESKVQCNFCKQVGHPTERCPSKDCQRSKKWREQQARQKRGSRGSNFRSRRGTRGRGRGSSVNKRSRQYLGSLETIPPTPTTQLP